ncbi:unannotated protein [freshwater metagenome]|uniref:Unannotated protein n=1 Tax=freshwater metagenome TaxID=449393 RepID=A0A6J7IM89_9ZZZZ|nr:PIN domain nuclease [Actinomycetota bacterium]MSW36095.1 PIN domain nuclease [Actinomycetota bacterium]
MSPRLTRVPSVAVEALRLTVVVLGAGAGFQLADRLGAGPREGVLGPFSGLWLGAIVGAMIGYVLGGVLARLAMRTLDRGERALEGLSAEQAVAGGLGAVLGAVCAAVVTWPLFLIAAPIIVAPFFVFLVLMTMLFGFRVGRSRRDAVLGAVSSHAGLAPRSPAPVSLPRLVDTSVAIDGRVLDVVRSGFLHGRFLVPQPVLDELQSMADSGDDHRRAKGRRGLDVLEALRREPGVELLSIPDEALGVTAVDAKLVRMAIDRTCALLTFDTNLAKAAAIAGVRVLNLHGLALALRPLVVVGDEVDLHLLKAGKEAGQAVGYLEDGTMVVTENARERVGQQCHVVVTSVVTTANGRLVFAKPTDSAGLRR